MAKIYPHSSPPSSSSSSSSSSLTSSRREVFTIWMKSLVLNGNGCTVYNSAGQVAYRVDNYDSKCSKEVYLMDQTGKTLYKILQKKLRVFGRWEGFRYAGSKVEEKTPWFRVKRACGILQRRQHYKTRVTVGASCYKIEGGSHNKSEYKIMDMDRGPVAEVRQKQTDSGVALGGDVLTLVVEPNADHLLIMGLVVVCGLINQHL